MAAVAEELARLGELSVHDLHIVWRRHHRREPPDSFSRDHLVRAIAYRIQEQTFGGLSQTSKRTLMSLVRSQPSSGGVARKRSHVLAPGVRLIRSWRGETHAVLVLPDGFEYRDQRYRSLTKIAERITGAHWSGPRFFGAAAASTDATDRFKATRGSVATEVDHHGQA